MRPITCGRPVADGVSACDGVLTDDELTTLALADTCGCPPAADAVQPAWATVPGCCPAWYMPRSASGSPAPVAHPVVAFVAIEAFRLCSTFGQIVPA